MSLESAMDNVVQFPERETEYGLCPECGGTNWKLVVEGAPWDRILQLECDHCTYVMNDKFVLEVEIKVELEET